MAIFNKINQHSGVVVGIVAVGLVLFLVGGGFSDQIPFYVTDPEM